MSLISGPGLHRLPSRFQLASDLKACRREKDTAEIAAIKYATEAAELRKELHELHAQVFGLQGQLEIAHLEGSRLRSELANATRSSVPATFARDIWPGEEPTHPQGLDVRTLRAQFAARPGSTDPAHVPGL
ncbi:hypothetical protein [Streptomyces sp. NPDC059538]|uniref:hypothetical protein n=1 Tax=Streptomyces sp. NPDC059538 TaxID=3346860 RepID=UPI0036AA70DB